MAGCLQLSILRLVPKWLEADNKKSIRFVHYAVSASAADPPPWNSAHLKGVCMLAVLAFYLLLGGFETISTQA